METVATKSRQNVMEKDGTMMKRRKPSHYTLVQKTVHLSIFSLFSDKNSHNYLKREATEPRELLFTFGLVKATRTWKGFPAIKTAIGYEAIGYEASTFLAPKLSLAALWTI